MTGADRFETGKANRRPSPLAQESARRAAASLTAAVSTLATLVAFPTVAAPPTPNVQLAAFRRLKEYLSRLCDEWDFDVEDHGAAVVIGLGRAKDRLGILTHGDVQPADSKRWRGDPFSLDTTSEPGRLVGRGVEDDKASIASALHAMRTVSHLGVPLRRRIELIVSMTEESDWTPFREFLRGWDPPALNVALDAKYPVVTAEKGTGGIFLTVPPDTLDQPRPVRHGARLLSFTGGEARTQVPAAAVAVIEGAGPELAAELLAAADPSCGVTFELEPDGDRLTVRAHGVAAHSSTPWEGRNAVAHLAALLSRRDWPPTPARRMLQLVVDLVGTGDLAERFGDLACTHPFMGPLTLVLTRLYPCDDGGLEACLNIRCPVGRSKEQVEAQVVEAVAGWTAPRGGAAPGWRLTMGDPYYLESAPHVPVLIDVYRHYTGQHDAGPIAVGGGTQARLLPNGVNFGPSMPGAAYTGHSDHEFVTVEQLRLNLMMQAAMLVELAAG
jgi:dipeptidase D